MRKKILVVCSVVGVILIVLIANALLPKDFFGYYRDIDMVREENSKIYDNGVFVCSYTMGNKHTDFVINQDVFIFRIEQKDTIFGPKYRLVLEDRVFDFYEILDRQIADYNNNNEIYFSSIGWLDYWPSKPDENMLWGVLPAECSVSDLDDNVSAYNFTYNNEEYVLYIKIESNLT